MLSPDGATYSASTNHHKKHAHKPHEGIIRDAVHDNGFGPLDMPAPLDLEELIFPILVTMTIL
jgi:hypothetical protein